VLFATIFAAALALPTSGSPHVAIPTCPETGVPLYGQPSATVEGSEHFTTVRCSYSDGAFAGFDLTLAYEPKDIALALLPAKKAGGYCSGFQQPPFSAYSSTYYGYSHVSGNPPDRDKAFAAAVAWLSQLAGVAYPCSAAVKDTKRPLIQAIPSHNIYPRPVRLKYRVTDDSGKVRVGAVVFQGNRPIARLPARTEPANGAVDFFSWRPPATFRKGVLLTFCISAVDYAGNKAVSCGHLSVLAP
jgi:hypothetical protein